jgi:hypothetical protein
VEEGDVVGPLMIFKGRTSLDETDADRDAEQPKSKKAEKDYM